MHCYLGYETRRKFINLELSDYLCKRPAGSTVALAMERVGSSGGSLGPFALASGVACHWRRTGARAGWLRCPPIWLVDPCGATSARLGAVWITRDYLCLLSGKDTTVHPDATICTVRLSRGC